MTPRPRTQVYSSIVIRNFNFVNKQVCTSLVFISFEYLQFVHYNAPMIVLVESGTMYRRTDLKYGRLFRSYKRLLHFDFFIQTSPVIVKRYNLRTTLLLTPLTFFVSFLPSTCKRTSLFWVNEFGHYHTIVFIFH